MRNLFFALVLVNLAFAAWSAWFAPAARVGRPADDGLPPLTLVSEVPVDLRSSGVAVEQQGAAQDAAERPPDVVALQSWLRAATLRPASHPATSVSGRGAGR